MFKRVTVIVVTVFIIAIVVLAMVWQSAPGIELYSSSQVTKAYRISQDLGGKWNSYPSLRRAWSQENLRLDQETVISGLIQQDSIVLPSNQGFSVAAKKFAVSGKWGSRTAQLVLEGVDGNVRVYLNGIDEFSFIGEAEGNGGTHSFELSPIRLDFSKENVVLLQMSEGALQQSKLFGRLWPEQGRITGQIRLEGIPETAIDLSRTKIAYDFAKGQVLVRTVFTHNSLTEQKPLVIRGVIKDSGQKVAECLLPLNSNELGLQTVDLIFDLPSVKLWSLENPFLYELEIVVSNNRGEFDSIQIPIGIRELTLTEDKWIINQQQIDVRAEILTEKQENFIRNQRQTESWLRSFKDRGSNVLYFMGFIPDEEWLYAADQAGIGVWLELPVYLVPAGRIPDPSVFEELIRMAERHPSVLAWTAGIGLEADARTEDYLRKVQGRISPLPVYHLSIFVPDQTNLREEGQNLLITPQGFSGPWGQARFGSDELDTRMITAHTGWKNERIAAIVWLIWLLLLTIQVIRAKGWNYPDIINSKLKRSVRIALFWNSIAIFSRMATLGALLTSVVYKFPPQIQPWIPYDVSWLVVLQDQPPLLIWLNATIFLVILRMLQVGIAEPFFPHSPGALGLSCWLEKRYRWNILVGVAWVLTTYDFPWFSPLVLYFLLTVFYLPFRIKNVWKVEGSYSALLLVPLTWVLGIIFILLWNWQDVAYLLENLVVWN